MQWKEAEGKEFHLRSEKKAAALSDASRKWFLRQETSAALEHGGEPLSEGEWAWDLHCCGLLNMVSFQEYILQVGFVAFLQIMLGQKVVVPFLGGGVQGRVDQGIELIKNRVPVKKTTLSTGQNLAIEACLTSKKP